MDRPMQTQTEEEPMDVDASFSIDTSQMEVSIQDTFTVQETLNKPCEDIKRSNSPNNFIHFSSQPSTAKIDLTAPNTTNNITTCTNLRDNTPGFCLELNDTAIIDRLDTSATAINETMNSTDYENRLLNDTIDITERNVEFPMNLNQNDNAIEEARNTPIETDTLKNEQSEVASIEISTEVSQKILNTIVEIVSDAKNESEIKSETNEITKNNVPRETNVNEPTTENLLNLTLPVDTETVNVHIGTEVAKVMDTTAAVESILDISEIIDINQDITGCLDETQIIPLISGSSDNSVEDSNSISVLSNSTCADETEINPNFVASDAINSDTKPITSACLNETQIIPITGMSVHDFFSQYNNFALETVASNSDSKVVNTDKNPMISVCLDETQIKPLNSASTDKIVAQDENLPTEIPIETKIVRFDSVAVNTDTNPPIISACLDETQIKPLKPLNSANIYQIVAQDKNVPTEIPINSKTIRSDSEVVNADTNPIISACLDETQIKPLNSAGIGKILLQDKNVPTEIPINLKTIGSDSEVVNTDINPIISVCLDETQIKPLNSASIDEIVAQDKNVPIEIQIESKIVRFDSDLEIVTTATDPIISPSLNETEIKPSNNVSPDKFVATDPDLEVNTDIKPNTSACLNETQIISAVDINGDNFVAQDKHETTEIKNKSVTFDSDLVVESDTNPIPPACLNETVIMPAVGISADKFVEQDKHVKSVTFDSDLPVKSATNPITPACLNEMQIISMDNFVEDSENFVSDNTQKQSNKSTDPVVIENVSKPEMCILTQQNSVEKADQISTAEICLLNKTAVLDKSDDMEIDETCNNNSLEPDFEDALETPDEEMIQKLSENISPKKSTEIKITLKSPSKLEELSNDVNRSKNKLDRTPLKNLNTPETKVRKNEENLLPDILTTHEDKVCYMNKENINQEFLANDAKSPDLSVRKTSKSIESADGILPAQDHAVRTFDSPILKNYTVKESNPRRDTILRLFDPLYSNNTSLDKSTEETPTSPQCQENQNGYENNENQNESLESFLRTGPKNLVKMDEMNDEKMKLEQQLNELKLELNQLQQERATNELELHQKDEIILKMQGEAQKRESNYKQDIKNLHDKLNTVNEQNNNEEVKTLKEQNDSLLKREAQLNEKINKLQEEVVMFKKIMSDYEITLGNKVSESEKCIQEYETAKQHLTALEMAFSDIHTKYERCKGIIAGYKNNEETLLNSLKESNEVARKYEERYDSLKAHAKAQLDKANKDIICVKEKHHSELSKLTNIIKRLEIKHGSMQQALDQKTKECIALSALCDEVTGAGTK